MYIVCAILQNVLTCLYGNFFDLDPPSLEIIFPDHAVLQPPNIRPKNCSTFIWEDTQKSKSMSNKIKHNE